MINIAAALQSLIKQVSADLPRKNEAEATASAFWHVLDALVALRESAEDLALIAHHLAQHALRIARQSGNSGKQDRRHWHE